MRMFPRSTAIVLASCLLFPLSASRAKEPTVEEVNRTLRKASDFFVGKVANQGGFHREYSEDLSFGHSGKNSKGSSQFSMASGNTPLVGLAFLSVWGATKDRYYLDAARSVGGALVKGQLCSGGWDYSVELDPEKRKEYRYRADGVCEATDTGNGPYRYTNLDNNTTSSALRFLMRLDRALAFKDAEIHSAARFGLNSMVRAQHPNGAWPQRWETFPNPEEYPIRRASYPSSWPKAWPGKIYYAYYTINDEGIGNMIDVLLEAARIYDDAGYLAAAEKGGGFLILAQMPDPQPAWAQQYNMNMHPVWARVFEPPAVAGRESIAAMRSLILLYRETGNEKYLEPIPRALAYLERSTFMRNGRRVLARFNELETNRPLYITNGSRMSKGAHFGTPIDGYEVSYSDKDIVTHYGLLGNASALDQIKQELAAARNADPESRKRPAKLEGLRPGYGLPRQKVAAEELAIRARTLVDSLDSRGAWVVDGKMVGPNRIFYFRPARPMILRVKCCI